MAKDKNEKIFKVFNWVDWAGRVVFENRELWKKIGNLESRFLREKISKIEVKSPIYISGLARSGTSIILEMLSRSEGVISHQYRDFPFVYTPYWWNVFLKRALLKKENPSERAHQDRIFVTSESPEAVEEVVWMAFFNFIHNFHKSNVLNRDTVDNDFENFYKNHIRKLLLVRSGTRYLAKANYNIARFNYILKLFPDAKFIVPVRNPINQVASLIKQHDLFSRGEKEDPRALLHFERIGHYEFGSGFRPISVDNKGTAQRIADMLRNNEDVRAWASYWNYIYGYIADRIQENTDLRKAAMIIRYEDLCEFTGRSLKAIQGHCGLEDNGMISHFEDKITLPGYYRPTFTDEELNIIKEETGETAKRFNYQ